MQKGQTPRRTEARITGYAMTLASGIWVPAMYFGFVPGNPFALRNEPRGDFQFFYVLATIAHRRDFSALYDTQRIHEMGRALMPEAAPFSSVSAYPPILAMTMAPLASLPYLWAAAVWTVVSLVLYAASCALVWRACPHLSGAGRQVAVVAAAFPATLLLVMFGQTSAPAVLFLSLAYLALAARRPVLAGLAIGGLAYKPQLAVGIAAVMLLAREWRVVVGALTGAAGVIGVSWLGAGTTAMRAYVATLLDTKGLYAGLEFKPFYLHSLKGFFALLLPWPTVALGCYLAAAVGVLVLAWRTWTSGAPLPLRFAVLLLATVLVDPHLNVYDLVVLAPMYLVAADWLVGQRADDDRGRIPALLILCFVLPLTGTLTQWTHVQLTVIAMVALLVALAKRAAIPAAHAESEVRAAVV